MIKTTLVSVFVLSLLFKKNPVDTIPVKGYVLSWRDEFKGNNLNKAKWNFHALGKRRDAYDVPEAARLDGKGHLIIEAKSKGDSILSAIISTEGLYKTRYGYFECRAKLTNTVGIWPAFWLLSSTNVDNGTPELNGVEIDIFEYFIHDRKDEVAHTLHWGGYGATHKVEGPVYSKLKKTNDGFHVFGLEWTPDSYSTFVDGVKTNSSNQSISKVPEFILLSLEVDENVAGPLEKDKLPDQFVVDYVRVYKKKER